MDPDSDKSTAKWHFKLKWRYLVMKHAFDDIKRQLLIFFGVTVALWLCEIMSTFSERHSRISTVKRHDVWNLL